MARIKVPAGQQPNRHPTPSQATAAGRTGTDSFRESRELHLASMASARRRLRRSSARSHMGLLTPPPERRPSQYFHPIIHPTTSPTTSHSTPTPASYPTSQLNSQPRTAMPTTQPTASPPAGQTPQPTKHRPIPHRQITAPTNPTPPQHALPAPTTSPTITGAKAALTTFATWTCHICHESDDQSIYSCRQCGHVQCADCSQEIDTVLTEQRRARLALQVQVLKEAAEGRRGVS